MHALHGVGLRVVRGCSGYPDVEQLSEVREETTGELSSLITVDDVWHTIPTQDFLL